MPKENFPLPIQGPDKPEECLHSETREETTFEERTLYGSYPVKTITVKYIEKYCAICGEWLGGREE